MSSGYQSSVFAPGMLSSLGKIVPLMTALCQRLGAEQQQGNTVLAALNPVSQVSRLHGYQYSNFKAVDDTCKGVAVHHSQKQRQHEVHVAFT